VIQVVEHLLGELELLIAELSLVFMGRNRVLPALLVGEELAEDDAVPQLLRVHLQAENEYRDIPLGHVSRHVQEQGRLSHAGAGGQDNQVLLLKPSGHAVDGRKAHGKPIGVLQTLPAAQQVEVAFAQYLQKVLHLVFRAAVGLRGIEDQLLGPGLQGGQILLLGIQGHALDHIARFYDPPEPLLADEDLHGGL